MNLRLLASCTAAILLAQASLASAGWNNVFQTTLHQGPPGQAQLIDTSAAARSVPIVPVCDHCAKKECSTSYSQRCHYQPVTTMQTECRYEQVTTMQTSYYYEPVTSYRISYYVDPCTGCTQQVSTPCTSMVLREKSCPVQSWVQRCCQVPVTTMQKSCYWEKTTCCTEPVAAPGAATVPVPAQVPAHGGQPIAPPAVQPNVQPPPPNVQPSLQPPAALSNGQFDRRYYSPTPAAQPTTPPPVKLERIVVGPNTRVEGLLVQNSAPRANARVTFVNPSNQKQRYAATTNGSGQFQVSLASGSWWVYVENNGVHGYHSQINVNPQPQGVRVTLVSR